MFALLKANVNGCTHHITSAHGKLRREKHAEEHSLLHHWIWTASDLTVLLPVACAKVWELCVKAKFITEKMLLVFGKQDSVKHFLFILADAENSGCTSQVLTSHFFFLRKKKMLALVCTQREQNKREQKKWREGVTDAGNGRQGPEGLWWSAPAHKPLYWKGLKRAHTKLWLPKGSRREITDFITIW